MSASLRRRIAVVGAGLSGAVVARRLADAGSDVVVFEERDHVAGNCHTSRDPRTGVMVHRYGPHIFHTARPELWAWVNRYAPFQPYVNRVKAVTARGVYSLPINLLTLNQFFGLRLDPAEATRFLQELGDPTITTPRTFEEQALAWVGRELYEAFLEGYTRKQWGVHPRELPASILRRLPVRTNYDDNYYADPHQGIPTHGYTHFVERLLDHPAVTVELAHRAPPTLRERFDHVFWTGPLDAWFGHHLGRLRYRTLDFEWLHDVGDHQGNAVINYCEGSVPYTRVTEHAHLAPHERHDGTLVCREYAREKTPDDIAFYPLRLDADRALLERYRELAARERGVTFLGRLGTYRYLDMDACIGEALRTAADFLAHNGVDTPEIPG